MQLFMKNNQIFSDAGKVIGFVVLPSDVNLTLEIAERMINNLMGCCSAKKISNYTIKSFDNGITRGFGAVQYEIPKGFLELKELVGYRE